MPDTPPIAHTRNTSGYEHRDVNVSRIAMLAVGLCIWGALVHAILWEIRRGVLPEARGGGVSPPVEMPGEAALNQRIREVSQPRLEAIEQLRAQPPSYRSSQPAPGTSSPEFHPEELRADRQPRLRSYGWVDREKGIAHIPITEAMKSIVERARARPVPIKGGKP